MPLMEAKRLKKRNERIALTCVGVGVGILAVAVAGYANRGKVGEKWERLLDEFKKMRVAN